MNSNHSQKNKEERLPQDEQLHQLFLSLKSIAFVILILGIGLMVILSRTSIKPLQEFMVLACFGLVSGGFLIARARSILIHFEAVTQKKEKNNYEYEEEKNSK